MDWARHRRVTGGAARIAGLALAVVLLACATDARAAELQMQVDSTRITLSDQVTLRITAEGSFNQFAEPDLSDWQITSQSTSTQMTIVNGRASRAQVLTRVLQPTKAGKLRIGEARLLQGSQALAVAPAIEVEVLAPPELPTVQPGQAGSLDAHRGESVFLVPALSEQDLYEGEPFILSWDLWVAANVRVVDDGPGTVPKLDNFLIADIMPQGRTPQARRQFDGRIFNVVTLKRDILIPLRAGKSTIESFEHKLVVGSMVDQRRLMARSNPFTIMIKPVPTEGRPRTYQDGNVGRFRIDAGVGGKTRAAAGERLALTVTVTGEGNLEAIKAPVIPHSDAIEVEPLPGSGKRSIERSERGIHGDVVFDFLVTPRRSGEVTIPAIPFTFFDPDAARFETAQSQPIVLQVEGSAVAGAGAAGAATALKPIVGQVSLTRQTRTDSGGGPLFWAVLAIPLLAFLLVEAISQVRRRREANAGQIRSRRAIGVARKGLRGAEAHLAAGREKDFFNTMTRVIYGFLESRFGLAAAGMTHDALQRALLSRGYSEELTTGLVSELENCDFARFAPAALRREEMERSLERTRAMLEALDRGAGREVPHVA